MDKRTNKLDMRSMPGILLRGKTIYGNGTSPNPTGKNQSTTKMLQEAAKKRMMKYHG